MSIQQCVKDRVTENRLFEIVPLLNAPAKPRSVWASEDVFRQLDQDTADDDLSAEAGRLRRRLDSIVRGAKIVVGERRDKDCHMKRLDPAGDEVWEIRECESPSIRIFFRFIEKDSFVATNVRTVNDLFSRFWKHGLEDYFPVWRQEIRLCKARWRSLFISYQPFSGNSLDDYLSNAAKR